METERDPTSETISSVSDDVLGEFRAMREEFSRFMFAYKFGMEEVETKVGILQQEFQHLQSYNPIEHVRTRLKSPESVLEKVRRKGCEPRFDSIREQITDIAGVRVTCSFTSDVYRVRDALVGQRDIEVLVAKDYVREPKANGYRSLHLILQVPVFLSTGVVEVPVEVQLRTIAMDFWASLEHKIYYKFNGEVPQGISASLAESATTAARLDEEMERLHHQVHGDPVAAPIEIGDGAFGVSSGMLERLITAQEQTDRG